jgi:hypothetical protein
LPDITSQNQSQKKTGTDDQPQNKKDCVSTSAPTYTRQSVFNAFQCDSVRDKDDVSMKSQEPENPLNGTENNDFDPVRADSGKQAAMGFEPMNIGFANRFMETLSVLLTTTYKY